MGLCKCPKKKVTTQFCFEHKVNVCENCMIDDTHKTVTILKHIPPISLNIFNLSASLDRI